MIIGLAGPKGSGKSYIATALSSVCDMDVHSFAAPLRDFVVDVFSLEYKHCHGYLKETPVNILCPTAHHIRAACIKYFGDDMAYECINCFVENKSYLFDTIVISYRGLMQGIGTLVRDKVGENYWIDSLAKRCVGDIIIDDVRQPNEIAYVRNNGVLIHIDNPAVGFTKEHQTELPCKRLNDDLVFVNDRQATLEQITAIANKVKARLGEVCSTK
jgi:hypothetical protein